MINKIKQRNSKLLKNVYNAERVTVQNDLTVTPSQMSTMADRGIPIASHVDESLFYDGDTKPISDINPLLARGVDAVDAWNMEKSARKNMKSALLKDIQTYG